MQYYVVSTVKCITPSDQWTQNITWYGHWSRITWCQKWSHQLEWPPLRLLNLSPDMTTIVVLSIIIVPGSPHYLKHKVFLLGGFDQLEVEMITDFTDSCVLPWHPYQPCSLFFQRRHCLNHPHAGRGAQLGGWGVWSARCKARGGGGALSSGKNVQHVWDAIQKHSSTHRLLVIVSQFAYFINVNFEKLTSLLPHAVHVLGGNPHDGAVERKKTSCRKH